MRITNFVSQSTAIKTSARMGDRSTATTATRRTTDTGGRVHGVADGRRKTGTDGRSKTGAVGRSPHKTPTRRSKAAAAAPTDSVVLHMRKSHALATGTGALPSGVMATRRQSTTVTREVVSLPPKPVMTPIDVIIAVDASGSMAGHRAKVAADAVQSIATSVLRDGDSVSVLLFNDTVTWALRKMGAKVYRHDTMMAKHGDGRGGFRCGGTTALFDGVMAALRFCHGRKPWRGSYAVPYIVVISDGGDNASTVPATQVAATLAKPSAHGLGGKSMANLQMRFLTIGSVAARVAEAHLIHKGRTNLKHLPADESGESVTNAFRRMQADLRQTVVRFTTTTTEVTTVAAAGGGRGGGSAVAAALGGSAVAAALGSSGRRGRRPGRGGRSRLVTDLS